MEVRPMTQIPWRELEATVAGMTDEEKQQLLFLITQSLPRPAGASGTARPTADEFDAALNQVAFDAPPLPASFSRADVYSDHD
jgi:hypothetical protein